MVPNHRSVGGLMLSLVPSCCATGGDYVTRPAAGVKEESKGRKGRKTSLMSSLMSAALEP